MGEITIKCDVDHVSDGYHTFQELYKHRHSLLAVLMVNRPGISWISKLHGDGSCYPGWFIAGMGLPTGTITYHLPDGFYWTVLKDKVEVLKIAPKWDGHTSDDVLERLDALLLQGSLDKFIKGE